MNLFKNFFIYHFPKVDDFDNPNILKENNSSKI